MPTWVKQPGNIGNTFCTYTFLLTPNREHTVMNRTKPWPYSTVPPSKEPRFIYVSNKPHREKNDLTVFGSMHTVRCGFDGIPTVRFGGVLRNREFYDAVRCGFRILSILRCGSVLWYILGCGSVRFSEFVNATVRFGAVFKCREPYGAVRLYFLSYGAVRCGFPIS